MFRKIILLYITDIYISMYLTITKSIDRLLQIPKKSLAADHSYHILARTSRLTPGCHIARGYILIRELANMVYFRTNSCVFVLAAYNEILVSYPLSSRFSCCIPLVSFPFLSRYRHVNSTLCP